MKKIFSIIAILLYSIVANAQNYYLFPSDRGITTELMRSIVITIVLYIIGAFLLTMIRLFLNYQLKNKMLEKGVPVEVIANMLPRKNELTAAIKWFAVLMSISAGLLIVSFFPPGIYSVIIMTFCVALGYLGFYLWAKRYNK